MAASKYACTILTALLGAFLILASGSSMAGSSNDDEDKTIPSGNAKTIAQWVAPTKRSLACASLRVTFR